jgi:hypothetical protein
VPRTTFLSGGPRRRSARGSSWGAWGLQPRQLGMERRRSGLRVSPRPTGHHIIATRRGRLLLLRAHTTRLLESLGRLPTHSLPAILSEVDAALEEVEVSAGEVHHM